jgi:hypothetical protein
MQDSPVRDLLSNWQGIELPGFGSLQLRTSPHWRPIQQQAAGGPPTVAFRETPAGPDRLIITITPLDANEAPSAEQLAAASVIARRNRNSNPNPVAIRFMFNFRSEPPAESINPALTSYSGIALIRCRE